MDLKKFAKYAYMLLFLFAVVFTFIDVPAGTWPYWVISVIGVFVAVFGRGVEKTKKLIILFLGLTLTYQSFGMLDFVGEYITHFLSNILLFYSPLLLTLVLLKFYKVFQE